MSRAVVYRNMRGHSNLDFRSFRQSIEEYLASANELQRQLAKKNLEDYTRFGEAAPSHIARIWGGRNPILDSVYAYMTPPAESDLSEKETLVYDTLPDGEPSTEGRIVKVKNNWAEVAVDPKRCVIGPLLVCADIFTENSPVRFSDYWSQARLMSDFLRQHEPFTEGRPYTRWRHKGTGEEYREPEALFPLDAIDMDGTRFINVEPKIDS